MKSMYPFTKFTHAITIAFVCLFIVACSSSNRKVSLQYNLENGNNFKRRTVTEQTVKQQFQGETQVVTNTVRSVINYKVIDNNGVNTKLEVRYDTMAITIKLPDRTMQFSSSGSFWKKEDLFSQLLNSMSGKSFTILVNNNTGKIEEVNGLSELFQQVLSQFQTANQEQFSSVMEMLNKSYGENAFIDSFEATNAYLTEKNVKKGDKWEVTTNLANLGGSIDSKWEIKQMDKDEIIITGNGAFNMENTGKEKDVEGISTNLNLSGTQVSNLTINAKNAWPVRGKIRQQLSGEMNLRNPQTGETANLPVEMVNVITYSTIE